MKGLWASLLLLCAAGVRAELRRPEGRAAERDGAVTVDLGFGSVTLPAGGPAPAAGEDIRVGEKLACNRGTFKLTYELVRREGRVVPGRIGIDVRNRAEYLVKVTARLVEHERAHQRINEAAARRIQDALGGFSSPGGDLRKAEKALKARFREELKAVRALHADWDRTHVFPEEGAAPAPSRRGPPAAPPKSPAVDDRF